ncbi:hypothetical protein GQX73_g4994 [Xylaria multiplex]|uniref:Enoyl reductase (ER) domain-containing protein n=1 Tax=Xylaria multiplex TaxID=323545 RepID=A0A7C8MUG4_9PEZI|nr:hypothetical protein GQX73_g4994 [Xylaria multiplex]
MSSEGSAQGQDYSQENRGQYLHGAKDLRTETRPLAKLAPDEVQVAIRSTTLCGSDLHYYSHFVNGDILVREPQCLGHESSGEITSLGANFPATHPSLKVGDAVALEVGVPCGNCANCQNRRYNICPDLRFRSSGSKFPHYQGTLQERINRPASWVHKLPPTLDYETGVLLEPLSVAVQAVGSLTEPPKNNSGACLVFGAGAVGLLCSVAAQAAGFSRVIIVDIDEPRRGPTTEEKLSIANHTAEQIASAVWPNGKPVGRPDATFECTGVESCIQTAIYATKPGGAVTLVGLGVPNHILPVSEMMKSEIILIPNWRYAHTYPRAIEIATASITGTAINGTRLPDIRKLITHRFHGISSVDAVMQTAGKTKDSKGAVYTSSPDTLIYVTSVYLLSNASAHHTGDDMLITGGIHACRLMWIDTTTNPPSSPPRFRRPLPPLLAPPARLQRPRRRSPRSAFQAPGPFHDRRPRAKRMARDPGRNDALQSKELSIERHPELHDGRTSNRVRLQLISYVDCFRGRMWKRTHVAIGPMFFVRTYLNPTPPLPPPPSPKDEKTSTFPNQQSRCGIRRRECPHLLLANPARHVRRRLRHAAEPIRGAEHRADGGLFLVSAGAGPIRAMPSEIFPVSMLVKGVAYGAMSNWLNNFIAGPITPPLVAGTGFGTHARVVSASSPSSGPGSFVPETKNKALEEKRWTACLEMIQEKGSWLIRWKSMLGLRRRSWGDNSNKGRVSRLDQFE